MMELPCAIKTEESKEETDLTDLKKKMELFECSPRHDSFNLKFSQTLLQKLITTKE